MTKTELSSAIAEKSGLSKKEAANALAAFTDVVTAALLNGEKIIITGFGSFEVAERAERQGRNPKTGETILIQASKAPKFRAGKALKAAVRG